MATAKVYFIGAGPGDPDLITVKGKKLISRADVIIYAGSLVNEAILADRKDGTEVFNSAHMTLEQVVEVMEKTVTGGGMVARVHTGDPSLFGAIREQIGILQQKGIPFEVVPGVSSFFGAAAALGREYTLPGISQTVILTRMEGRTPVPEKEKLADLARHQASMVIFLSMGMVDEVVEQLLQGYHFSTPAAVVYKATWSDQLIIRGRLDEIAGKVRTAGIEKTALILVGDFLGEEYERSCLYNPGFSHGYRRGREK